LLIQEDGGMVGGLGDNRNSPTWANSALTRGFYDATWPNVAPDFGEDNSIVRLGDILNHGKIYLLSQIGVDQTAGEVSFNAALGELIMWHAYGDPSMEMWTGNPYNMILSMDYGFSLAEELLVVGYPENNAWITAYQTFGNETVPIGRAVVENGFATIPFFYPPNVEKPIMLSASMKNAVSVLLTPQQTLPDLEVLQLADEPLFVFPGQDLTDSLTVVVGNLGEADASGTVYPNGTIKPDEVPGYMIDLVLSTDTSMPEGWATNTQGDAYSEDALLVSGRISRTPDIMAETNVTLSNSPPVSSDIGGMIPTQTPAGQYYLCARIDPGNLIEESNEDNNVTCLAVTVGNIDQ
jgi:hypothetical protein